MGDDSEILYRLAQAVSDGIDLELDPAEEQELDRTVLSDLEALAKLGAFHRERSERRAPEDPESWGPLRILERIGRGGFGEVYRALDPRLEREVALKLLRIDRIEQERHKAAILKEARLLARVHHPNVAAIYGADEFEGRVGLWMELIRGKTLEQWVQEQGPLSAGEATVIALDLCRALAAVHGQGLVHRDVTARNVMRRDGGRILLTDFGLGEIAQQPESREGLTGTPLYLPPEAFKGHGGDVRGDIYSLGVLLYFLVTGGFPVQASDLPELRKMHEERRIRHLRDARPGLPAWFVQAVEAALAPEPQDRYASVAQFEKALVSGSSPISLEDIPAARRAKAPFWAAAALVALLGAASASYFLSSTVQPPLPFTGIVMSDLDNKPGDPELEVVAQLLRDRLDEFGFFDVADPSRIAAAAAERGISFGTKLDGPEAEALASKMFRIPVVVTPQVQAIGAGYLLRVEVRHVEAEKLGLRGSWAQGFPFSGKEEISAVASEAGGWFAGLVPKLKAQVFFREADELFKEGKRDAAIPKLNQAIASDPDFALARARLGNWLVDDGRFKEGYELELKALETLRSIDAPLLAESRARILALNDIEDYVEGERLALDHTSRFPADLFGYFNLAFAQGALGKWSEAIRTYREADRLGSGDPSAMVQTVRLLFAQGDLDEAAAAIEEVRKRRDSLPWVWRLEGALDFLRGRTGSALESFGKLRDSEEPGDQSDSLAARAYIVGERGQFLKALDILDEGIDHDKLHLPDLEGALNDKRLAKAYLLARLDRRDELRGLCLGEDFRREAPYRQSKAGVLLARAGWIVEARMVLSWIDEQFAAGVPISERSRKRLLGEILIQSGDPAAGLALLREVASTEPAFYHREYLARALRQAGRLEESLEEYRNFAAHPGIFWFLSVNEQYPGLYADTLLDYAKLAAELGRGPEAESALRRYREMRSQADDWLRE